MTKQSLISFRRTDILPSDIEDIAKEFANHFVTRKKQITFFCRVIKETKTWNMLNLHRRLEAWKNAAKTINEVGKTIKLVEKAFLLCQSDNDISSLRGAMVEALIISHYGGAKVLDDPERAGWGAKVYLQNKRQQVIRYYCNQPIDEKCDDKATVDFGYWDGNHGKFYECKVLPRWIECKDKRYMENLNNELTRHEISHEVFFVCADSEAAIEMHLADVDIGVKLKPIGIRQLISG